MRFKDFEIEINWERVIEIYLFSGVLSEWENLKWISTANFVNCDIFFIWCRYQVKDT